MIWLLRRIKKFLRFMGLFHIQVRIGGLSLAWVTTASRLQRRQLRFLESLKPLNNGHELIKIGDDADGGYLLPNDFDGIEYCFSPGCGGQWSFERHLSETFGITSFILDEPTSKPKDLDNKQVWRNGLLGSTNLGQYVTLDQWICESLGDCSNDLILQMDIEMAEWECLRNISLQTLEKFRILVIEFHGIESIMDGKRLTSMIIPVFEKLAILFDIVHVHGNNCCGTFAIQNHVFPKVAEFTFHNKNRRAFRTSSTFTGLEFRKVPHTLDHKTFLDRPDALPHWPDISDKKS